MTATYRHLPCLLAETLQHLDPRPGGILIDATIGTAGHAEELIKAIGPRGRFVAIDQDPVAVTVAARNVARLSQQTACYLIHDNFRNIDSILTELALGPVDGCLFDLGLSSGQIEDAGRGFSYRWEGPLDMRFDTDSGVTAAEIVNGYSKKELSRVFEQYGEERWAERIASFIVKERKRRPVRTTGELVSVIKKAIPAAERRKGGHPAKRVFQALRIEVNDELVALKEGLTAAVKWLKPGGRVVVISYHSLEDRIVKQTFKELAAGCSCPPSLPECVCGAKPVVSILTKRVVRPTKLEVERNHRARSARLRAAMKVA